MSFCIRPEKMFFVDVDYSEPCLSGVIEEVIYVGETKRYKIRIGRRKTINVREMSLRIGGGRTQGEEVKIAWHKESLRRI